MQNIEQQIDLDLDNDNELVFKLAIEGTKNASTSSRLLIESEEYSLVFPATSLSKGEGDSQRFTSWLTDQNENRKAPRNREPPCE